MSDEPLVPGPLYSLRTWKVVSEDGRERLAGIHHGGVWPPGDGWVVPMTTHPCSPLGLASPLPPPGRERASRS